MSKNLVIVESPSKAKTIGKYLGPDYTVKASMGHLRDLPKSTMGVDIEGNFEPEYVPVQTKKELIEVETDSPEEFVKKNGRFPILDITKNYDGDTVIITGDGKGNFLKYTFTE